MNKTCHTGGASGADITFEILSMENNINVAAYSFTEHKTISKNRINLSTEELFEGWLETEKAAKVLKRNTYNLSAYVKKLLARDWFQVKNSDTIIAIGNILNPKEKGERTINKTTKQIVDGGTGYAVELAIQNNKPVFVFNQKDNKWYKWEMDKFNRINYIPKLTENFAGIGSRNLTKKGENAIKKLFI